MSRRRWILVFSLVTVALISWWFLDRLDPKTKAPTQSASHVPDYYVENFTTTTMDENGFPRRRVTADYMAHFPDTDTHELANPQMVLYRESKSPWYVRSERGWISSNREVMLLLGKVHIWSNNSAGERQLDVHTEDLRVLPNSDYAETDRPVVISTPTSESRGVGMRAFLDKSRLELLSQVHTVYEPGSK